MMDPWHWPARARALCLRWTAPVWLRSVGPRGRIHRGLHIARPFSDIRIGQGVVLKHQITLHTGRKARLRIGDGVLLNTGAHIVASASIEIGAGVRIGEYVSIRDQEHKVEPGQSVSETGFTTAPVRIGENAWIGRGVFIGPGVTIGRGAVIGANSVVLSDIPAGMMAAGAPARVRRPAGSSSQKPSKTVRRPSSPCSTSA